MGWGSSPGRKSGGCKAAVRSIMRVCRDPGRVPEALLRSATDKQAMVFTLRLSRAMTSEQARCESGNRGRISSCFQPEQPRAQARRDFRQSTWTPPRILFAGSSASTQILMYTVIQGSS